MENWVVKVGKPAYESIKEMVRALTRETAAEDFAESLPYEKCVKILIENNFFDPVDDREEIEGIQRRSVDVLRQEIANGLAEDTIDIDDFEFDEDEARQRIEEDALSVEVRSDWHTPGGEAEDDEYRILLSTGGPATRIIGELDQHNEPATARLEVQDWWKPWTEYTVADQDILLQYVNVFYWGG